MYLMHDRPLFTTYACARTSESLAVLRAYRHARWKAGRQLKTRPFLVVEHHQYHTTTVLSQVLFICLYVQEMPKQTACTVFSTL